VTTTPTDVEQEAKRLAAEFNHHLAEQVPERNEVLDAIREGCPVVHGEQNGGYWIVSSFEGVEKVIHNPNVFASDSVTIPAELFAGFGYPVVPPITLNGDEHRNFRRILLPVFTPRSIGRFEGRVREMCHEFIDEFIEKGECDGAVDFARRVPMRSMALVLGVPPEDEDLFTSWIHRFVATGGADPEAALEASQELGPYFWDQLEAHRANPKDDLLTTLIEANYEGTHIDEEGLIAFLFLMVTAGMDTVWSVLGDSLWYLSQHPEKVKFLTDDLSRVPVAMEELLRRFSPALLGRVVAEDTEMLGCPMKKGDSVMIAYPAANRDPREFEGADDVILDRSPNRHLGFGAGIHRCIGSTLARMELTTAMTAWLERIPEFTLADPDGCHWGAGPVRGPKSLPLKFTPGTRRS
jgi:cytochrome P450